VVLIVTRPLIPFALLFVTAATGADLDPKVALEVAAVRAEVARNNEGLRQYSWTEHTEVLKKDDVQASSEFVCRYGAAGLLVKTPTGEGKEQQEANGVSKRHRVRKKANMQDYIERAVTTINDYVPPKPELIQAALDQGNVSLGRTQSGTSEIRVKDYFQRGDSLVFSYDTSSKVLLRAVILSTLGTPKDPVTLDAVFEKLPDGVNHLATATVNAKAKNVQVVTRHTNYQKLAN
jgi:hypothetical protein